MSIFLRRELFTTAVLLLALGMMFGLALTVAPPPRATEDVGTRVADSPGAPQTLSSQRA